MAHHVRNGITFERMPEGIVKLSAGPRVVQTRENWPPEPFSFEMSRDEFRSVAREMLSESDCFGILEDQLWEVSSSREISLSITNLQQARLWFGEALRLYCESKLEPT